MVVVPGGGDAELASVAAEANAVLLRSRDALGLAYHNHACSQNKSHLPETKDHIAHTQKGEK